MENKFRYQKYSDWIETTKEDIEEFIEINIMDKRIRVAAETQKGINERPDDKPTVVYLKNKAMRLIEWVKNANKQWIQRERVERPQRWAPAEIVEFIDLNQIDRECPSSDSFRNGDAETVFPSDRVIFSECVVGRDGQLLASYLKDRETEMHWNKKEWLMKQTGLSMELCIRLREAFKALRFNRKTIIEIIEDIDEAYVCYLEALVEELEDVQPLMYDPELYTDHGIIDTNTLLCSVSEGTLGAAFPEEMIKNIHLSLEKEIEPMEGKEPKASPFGYRKIYHQEDGCSHEFLCFLKDATESEIRGIMKNFFPRNNHKGETFKPRFWYLTQSQKSQAWTYINDRRRELGMLRTSELMDFTSKA